LRKVLKVSFRSFAVQPFSANNADMKNLALISFLFVTLGLVLPAHAESCAEIAARVAEEENAVILGSPEAKGDVCKFTLRLPSQNGVQSRIVTRTVNM